MQFVLFNVQDNTFLLLSSPNLNISDIEKFIVEYVCDVKNKIDITSMQKI